MLIATLLLTAAGSSADHDWMPPEYTGGGLPYWQSRHVVTLALHCDRSGGVDSVTTFASYDSTANLDSLLTVPGTWSVPPPTVRAYQGKPFLEFAHFCGVADTSRMSPLPDPTQANILRSRPMRAWVDAMTRLSDDFDLGDLMTLGTARLLEDPWQYSAGFLDRRLRFGVALISPGGDFAVDSFAGMEITDSHEAAWDVDTGFATYDLRNQKRLHYWVSTMEGIFAADWLDSTRFVLGGTVRLDHPSSRKGAWATARVPCVWVGDLAAGEITRYLGVPIHPTETAEYRACVEALLGALYPRIAW